MIYRSPSPRGINMFWLRLWKLSIFKNNESAKLKSQLSTFMEVRSRPCYTLTLLHKQQSQARSCMRIYNKSTTHTPLQKGHESAFDRQSISGLCFQHGHRRNRVQLLRAVSSDCYTEQ